MTKYGNKKSECRQSHIHSSLKEMHYCNDLALELRAKTIIKYDCEPKIELQEAFKGWDGKMVRAITFKPDFVSYRDGFTDFVDIKGGSATRTQAFDLRWKLLQHKYRGEKNYRFFIV